MTDFMIDFLVGFVNIDFVQHKKNEMTYRTSESKLKSRSLFSGNRFELPAMGRILV